MKTFAYSASKQFLVSVTVAFTITTFISVLLCEQIFSCLGAGGGADSRVFCWGELDSAIVQYGRDLGHVVLVETGPPIELRLLSPAIVLDRIHLTGLRSVVEARTDGINVRVGHSREAMAFSRIDHVWQLDQCAIPELVGVIA